MPEPTSASSPRLDSRAQWVSIFSLRLTGYVLLALSAFDVATIMLPPDFFNPQWEFYTLGKLVDKVPVPLIGLALVFYGGLRYRRPLEKLCLRPLALITVIVGVGYLLLIPLGISNSIRLQHLNRAQQSLQQNEQKSRYRQLEQQIQDASPDRVLPLARRWRLVSAEAGQDAPEDVKAKALSQLQKNQTLQQQQSLAADKTKQQQHLKNSIKWIVGALLAGSCLIYLGIGANKAFLLGLQ
ncbi:MAG: HpsJ family protein [Cyanobacteria bacterium P01_A01_bin.17]